MSRLVPGLVSVVMLVRDQPDYTRRALETAAACPGETEFLLVDNGSGPETAALLAEFRAGAGRAVEVLSFEDDAGGSSRRNEGARAACGEYLLFLDNDIVADDPRLIDGLCDALASDPSLGAVSPLLLYPGDSGLVQCAGGAATADCRIGLFGRGETVGAAYRTDREQSWAPTAALMVRRSSFDRVGGFDEAFDPIALCEDVDLCCRLRAHGERIGYVGGVHARHYEGTTFDHVGFDKRSVWQRHVAVLRSRWKPLFAAGPVHTAEDVAWRPVHKDYTDPARPMVRLLAPGEQATERESFFASDTLLKRDESPVVRVLMLGCGQAAVRGALPALAGRLRRGDAPDPAPFFSFGAVPATRVVGCADPHLPAALAAARWFDVPHVLPDAARLLAEVPAEGAVVCAPPAEHSRLTLAALAARLSVLVEKPAATTHDELDAICAALTGRPGLDVVVNLPYAHHGGIATLTAFLASGTLGVPRSFHIVFEHSGPAGWAPNATWYASLPGGAITDLGVHCLDVAVRLFGTLDESPQPERTVQRAGIPLRSVARVATASCSGLIEVGWDAPGPRFTITVHCERGTVLAALIPFRAPGAAVHVEPRDGEPFEIPFAPTPADGGPYAAFAAATRSGAPAPTRLALVGPTARAGIDWCASWADANVVEPVYAGAQR